jgi:hypothetical protein
MMPPSSTKSNLRHHTCLSIGHWATSRDLGHEALAIPIVTGPDPNPQQSVGRRYFDKSRRVNWRKNWSPGWSRLPPCDVVCVMLERTPLWAKILQQLLQLRMITSTGARNA